MDIPTNCYITVSPNPVGVGQTMNIVFWLDHDPPQLNTFDYYGWNYTVKIITPDGQVVTRGPIESDPVGGAYLLYTPDQTGEYKITATFVEATINVTGRVGLMTLPVGLYTFKTSTSREITLKVQNEKIEPWPEVPLPTGYWSNPISAENRDWYQIAGNWLSSGANYYTTGPSSAHLLWTKQLTFGGITGGTAGWGTNFYHGLLYENKFSPRIISGRLYYNTFAAGVSGVTCVDLHTGETIWSNDSMPQLSSAQLLTFNTGVQTGTLAYLWTSSGGAWQMYDAFTGRLLATFANSTGSPSSVFGPNGEMLVYSLNGATNRFYLWNSTLAVTYGATQFNLETYRPWTSTPMAWSRGIQWNVTVPDVPGTQTTGFTDYASGVLVAESTITSETTSPTFVHVGYSLKDGTEIWRRNWTNVGWGPGGPSSPTLITSWARASGLGTYTFFQKETMQWHVIDIQTGIERFVTEPLNKFTDTDWSVYDWSAQMAYGMLLVDGYSGDVIAFNLTTGQQLWTFKQESSGLMTPYGVWPTFGGVTVADNKVYFGVTEHTPNSPMLRGYTLYCLDAKTGELIWKLPAFFASIAIADGILVGYNAYTNQIYAFGKGLSEVTVDAPMSSVTVGSPIAIRGTVTDQSPGQTAVGVPAAGTPAISDDNMTAWMTYLYLQQPAPSDAKGVPVTLYISDQNDNVIDTIKTTSDMSGHYLAAWTPKNSGTFKITAVFDGSNSYYPSADETGIAVGAAPAPIVTSPPASTPTPTNAPATPSAPTATPTLPSPSQAVSPSESPNTILYVGVAAVVVAAVVAATALVLKRRR
ncbi:MAG: PQQ-binding-like beta-propeller repeat protein [Candidatus Bathyarchaeia archaeon]